MPGHPAAQGWLRRWVLALACLLAAASAALAAPLEIWIDKSEQQMNVYVEGHLHHTWPVSTARPGKVTPTGIFTPQLLKRMHYSTLYDNAPMPFTVFFEGNYAIHGTDQIDSLGCPASAGCVRLHPGHAETLFEMILEQGKERTRIIIVE